MQIHDKISQKTAIYIRVSTQFQIDKDSLKVQRRELIAYSEFILGISDYEIFEDPGYSGKNTDRPAYQSMMTRLRSGEFSHLLVWKIDRISRNLLDFAEMYSELKRLGITFVSKNEQFDTSSAVGEAMLKIILVFAELERQMTAERVTAVMLSRANNGDWNGGRVPYGYIWDSKTKTFSLDDTEADIVRLIYDKYEEIQSLSYLSDYLNGLGYKTKTGKQWQPVSLSKILRNIFYTGTYRYNVHSDGKGQKKNDETEWINVGNHHPAIIDDVKYDRIQFLLTRNRRSGFKKGDTYKSKSVHVFAGLITCGNCGANMTANLDRRRADGWRPSLYGCASRRKHSGNCSNKYVNDAYVSPFIFSFVSSVLQAGSSSDSDIEKMILKKPFFKKVSRIEGLEELTYSGKNKKSLFYSPSGFSDNQEGNISELNILKASKRKNESALKRLQSLYLYSNEAISEKDYLVERKRILSDLEDIDSKLSAFGAIQESLDEDSFKAKASYFLMVDTLLKWDDSKSENIIRSIEPEILKTFINQIISRIVITDGDITEIMFKNKISIRFIYD